jgi:hypothetical protein
MAFPGNILGCVFISAMAELPIFGPHLLKRNASEEKGALAANIHQQGALQALPSPEQHMDTLAKHKRLLECRSTSTSKNVLF